MFISCSESAVFCIVEPARSTTRGMSNTLSEHCTCGVITVSVGEPASYYDVVVASTPHWREKATGMSVHEAFQSRAESATTCADGMSKLSTRTEFEWFHFTWKLKGDGHQRLWLSSNVWPTAMAQKAVLQRYGSDAPGIARVDGA